MPNYVSGPISSFTEKVPSATDFLPIVDLTDPLNKNKKSTVGNLFKAVPYSSGNTGPSIAFGSSNFSGIFSPNGSQIGVRVGNTGTLNITNSIDSITLSSFDNARSSKHIVFQAYGTGNVIFSSPAFFTDTNFTVNSFANSNNSIKFDLSNVVGSSTFAFPQNSGAILTDNATQSISNKTLVNPFVSGKLIVNNDTSDLVVINNKVGVGIPFPDFNLHVLDTIKVSSSSPSIRLTGVLSDYQIINNDSNSLNINKVAFGTIASFSESGFSATNVITNNILYDNLSFINSGTAYAYLISNGNFGLGVTTPLQKLDVLGGARISNGLYRPNNSTKVLDYDNTTTYHYSNQQFKTGTGSTFSNVIITSAGLVGIGNTAPTIPLDVSGRIRTNSVLNASTVAQKVVQTSIQSQTLTLDLDAGSVFSFTLDQPVNSIVYTSSKGTLDSNTHYTITLLIDHNGNAYTVNWNKVSYWVPAGGYGTGITASNTPPVLQTAGPITTVRSRDIITLTTYDSGTTFLGRYVAAIPAS